MRLCRVCGPIEDEDDTQLLFGISNRGVSFVDAANLATLPAIAPSFALPPVARPSEGPAAGGAATTLAGSNFEATSVIAFGSQAATSVSVASPTQLQATSPPAALAPPSTSPSISQAGGWPSLPTPSATARKF
jgi:hypothetical protein